MGRHLFRKDRALPPAFVVALASTEKSAELARQWGVKVGVITYWRSQHRGNALAQEGAESSASQEGSLRAGRTEQPRTARFEERGLSGAWEATERTAEVFSRPVTPYTLVELVRESPRGACVVCWKNVRSEEALACVRKKPGTTTSPCNSFVQQVKLKAQSLQEAAKASMLGEVCHG